MPNNKFKVSHKMDQKQFGSEKRKTHLLVEHRNRNINSQSQKSKVHLNQFPFRKSFFNNMFRWMMRRECV
jgi:hypothetical protein